jgi:signal peptidase II
VGGYPEIVTPRLLHRDRLTDIISQPGIKFKKISPSLTFNIQGKLHPILAQMKIRNYYFWLAALGSLALDIITKKAIVNSLEMLQSIPIVPGVLHFTYVRNTGAAFSLFQGQDWLRWLSLIVSLALIAIGLFKPLPNRWEQLGYGCILAGAAGNGIDRLFYGSVVDFIDVRLINFAVFNWADISINLGILFLLIYTIVYSPSKSNL